MSETEPVQKSQKQKSLENNGFGGLVDAAGYRAAHRVPRGQLESIQLTAAEAKARATCTAAAYSECTAETSCSPLAGESWSGLTTVGRLTNVQCAFRRLVPQAALCPESSTPLMSPLSPKVAVKLKTAGLSGSY